MTVSGHLNSLFSLAPIILWVEDAVTRDYLQQAWGNPSEFVFFLAGGKSDVRVIVETARREGVFHVFGIVDRDFGTTNRADWGQPNVQLFRLPRHEMENYLLDVPALTNCGLNNRSRTDAEIQAEMERLAGLQPCWMACRIVLNSLRNAFTDGVPKHPALRSITSLADAEAHIRSTLWFGDLTKTATDWTGGTALTTAIQAAHADMQSRILNNTWAVDFSGGEIYRPLREYIYTPPPAVKKRSAEHDSDLAKLIGTWQLTNNVVPADIRDLRLALRQRVGLPP
jgi:hypothetical protein